MHRLQAVIWPTSFVGDAHGLDAAAGHAPNQRLQGHLWGDPAEARAHQAAGGEPAPLFAQPGFEPGGQRPGVIGLAIGTRGSAARAP